MYTTTPIAENHICISRSLFDEGMRATESSAYKKAVKKLAFLLIGLYLAAAAWIFCTGGSPIFLLGESVFLGALLFWLIFMLPASKRRNKYKAMTQGGMFIPERTVRFYQNHLSVIANTGKETVISYNDIQEYQETQNLYILNCNNNTYVLLDKNKFVIGDFYAVKSLLKGIQARIPN